MSMNEVKTVQQALVNAIRQSSVFNPNIQVKPACILWPVKIGSGSRLFLRFKKQCLNSLFKVNTISRTAAARTAAP